MQFYGVGVILDWLDMGHAELKHSSESGIIFESCPSLNISRRCVNLIPVRHSPTSANVTIVTLFMQQVVQWLLCFDYGIAIKLLPKTWTQVPLNLFAIFFMVFKDNLLKKRHSTHLILSAINVSTAVKATSSGNKFSCPVGQQVFPYPAPSKNISKMELKFIQLKWIISVEYSQLLRWVWSVNNYVSTSSDLAGRGIHSSWMPECRTLIEHHISSCKLN